ncbi:LEAF RUST 10 DISEASE-RESISTANCE LOCUS RECEPTOR-LIKE PROTEIN KINASE-like 1.3 isoform X2 [Hevea brasiliensis]|uniref:LEAF RUST 10 DISEASE-RESISTANCE LOCUS RECEPTOR-LIKE PROTEIN KINASE-like 1.3 isoform X2 n=1 Tax=Hevea brasiliensis TaxID=3981 RepID=UPI0025CBD6ED|nr:LEAF RUST 10 DISEASE-RESISTANCE LOCUS RECEPTOR-LIKE PROTEIN KINASE-like 1.3 isoform X2 [Hevea brasiliensis]
MEPHLFPTMPLILIMTIIFLSPPSFVSANDERYQNCSSTFQCGNITNIGYPFWGLNRPDYCGNPNFRLNCIDQTAVITIKNLTYQVLEIDSKAKNLAVARTDYIGSICPNLLINTTLDFVHFSYASDIQNVTLYYGCSSPSTSIGITGFSQFNCKLNDTDINGFYSTRNIDLVNSTIINLLGSCNNNVIVPATESAINSLGNSLISLNEENLVTALEQGFGLQWQANNSVCKTCTISGGSCGYNTTTNSFACYCTNQTESEQYNCGGSTTNQSESSSGGKSSNVGLGVGLGIAGAAVVGIGLVCWALFIIQRRKRIAAQTQSQDLPTPPSSKGQPAPIINFSQTTPSYPSSKSDLEKGSTYFGTQVFRYEELVEATDNFSPSKELGDGGFGTVYYGVLNDGRVVAVKRLFENNMKRAEQFMNEIEILTRLRHKSLVSLYGCTSKRSQELILVYEYVPNGTVADHLHGNRSKSGFLPWSVRLSIAIETADALAYLHASDVIHRDVKTNNILLDNNFGVKVADFGLSRLFPNDVTHVSTAPQGTPGYVDPEYYQCYQLTDKSDVYSFGVVLIELISSLQAVDTNRHKLDINLANMAVNKIQNHAINELVDPCLGFKKDYAVRKMATSIAELAFRCLQQERDMRPTMGEVLEALKKIEKEDYGSEKAEILDIKEDDVGLLNHVPPFSPDSIETTDKWGRMMRTL